MNNRYTPQKKKMVRIFGKTKIVRINARTSIEVDVNIPDDEARERFIDRTRDKQHHPRIDTAPLMYPDVFKGEDVMPIEALAVIIDEDNTQNPD